MGVVFIVGSVEMEGVRSVMYRAMECKVEEVFDWMILVGSRSYVWNYEIDGLRPSRLDFEESFKREFDVELIVQMLRHEAVDSVEKDFGEGAIKYAVCSSS